MEKELDGKEPKNAKLDRLLMEFLAAVKQRFFTNNITDSSTGNEKDVATSQSPSQPCWLC